MKSYKDLVAQALPNINELFPWDAQSYLKAHPETLVLDIREPDEFQAVRVEGSINVPRGILESACEYDYEETVPELAEARTRPILIVCRSGNRSILAADTMGQMGYREVYSLKTGLKGWNDFELPLVDGNDAAVDGDDADRYFTAHLRPEQLGRR
ncbi:MAG: rhodanese-like domain-containing protein [Proteobacteria bacterium]|nr:MAG: rhodanese-like domain-containing protein [Pseudomonadota bacterium]